LKLKDGKTMVGQTSRTPRLLSATGALAVATGFAPVVVLATAVAFLDPGVQLERGLSAAAANEARLMAEASTAAPSRTAVASNVFEEGSEGFWLLRGPSDSNVKRVTWSAPVAPGERIVVDAGTNREVIDVVAVEEETTATTRIDTGDQKPPRFAVTGRRVLAPGSELVRMTIEADAQGVTRLSGTADRAL
jgi:hypothetical protein